MSTRLTIWATVSEDANAYAPFVVCNCGHRDGYPYDVLARQFGPWACPACGMRYTRGACAAAYGRAQRDANRRLFGGLPRIALPPAKPVGESMAWTDDPDATPIEHFQAVQQTARPRG